MGMDIEQEMHEMLERDQSFQVQDIITLIVLKRGLI